MTRPDRAPHYIGDISMMAALEAWTPIPDDRVRPLLLGEANRRDAVEWSYEDAENVIAFLIARFDDIPTRHTAVVHAVERSEVI